MNIIDIKMPESLETVNEIIDGYKSYQVVKAAIELKFFDWLEENGVADKEEIVVGVGINGMFIRGFLQTLVDMKLISKDAGADADVYSNLPLASSLLVSSRPTYQGNWFVNSSGEGTQWTKLPDYLTQKEITSPGFSVGPGADFLKGLAQRSLRGEVQSVVKEIMSWERFADARSFIDIGGGHGLYSIALCQANPQLSGVVFDKPFVTGITEEFIKDYQMKDRIHTQSGNAMSDAIGGKYDIVLISHMFYKFRRQLPEFFKKIKGIINPGGILVSNHWFCGDGCSLLKSGARELDRAVQTSGHPLCHIEEFNKLFVENGFTVIVNHEIPSVYDSCTLHIAVNNDEASNVNESYCCC